MKYDQHFMTDLKLLRKISNYATDYDRVIEICAGKGALTKELLKKTNVVAVEIDKNLISELLSLKSKYLEVVNENALDYIKKTNEEVLFSNLAYSISEPFFYAFLRSKLKKAYLVTGKDFYDKLNSDSKLGVYCSTLTNIKKYKDVSPSSFSPEPKVNSVFFCLEKKETISSFGKLILQTDKLLKNALIDVLCSIGYTKKTAKSEIEELNEMLNKRIYHLSNLQFKILTKFAKEKLK